MTSDVYGRIKANPRFGELIRNRSRYAWRLSAAVLVLFYGFILLVAFKPGLMSDRLSEGSMVTLGPVVILSMFILFWILTALYVRRANSEFDELTQSIVKDAIRGGDKK
jgi:cation/acetate symporter